MPDVFVAPDEEKKVVMHKRTPLPSSSKQSQQKTPPKAAPKEVPLVSSEFLKNPPGGLSSDAIAQTPEEHHGIPLFTAFWQNPKGISFDTQEADEHILLFLRQHFITNIPWVTATILLMLLPFLVVYLFSLTTHPFSLLPPPFIFPTFLFYYLIVLTNAFTNFLKWYYNISLITPQRMLDIELKDLVDKKITATKMSLVQDVSVQYSGTLRTIFNYGDILVQTAGPIDNFVVNATPKPEIVVRTIEELIGKGREGEQGSGV